MSHSLTKIWIHGIFGTKNRKPLIQPSFEKELHNHMRNKLEKDLDCKVRIINGMEEHIHVLFLLGPNFSIKDVFQEMKGESSHWVNENNFIENKFAWQIGYGAFSVSESQLKKVELYIRNQKEHHRKKTFQEEYELLVKKHGVFTHS